MELTALELYNNQHSKDHEKALFKLWDKVYVHSKQYPGLEGEVLTVIAIDDSRKIDEDNILFNYLVQGFPYPLWEHELEKI